MGARHLRVLDEIHPKRRTRPIFLWSVSLLAPFIIMFGSPFRLIVTIFLAELLAPYIGLRGTPLLVLMFGTSAVTLRVILEYLTS